METHVYAVRNGQELKIDAFHPNGDAKAAVIILHGGGWRVGSKDWMAEVAKALAGHGLLALPTQYRLLGETPWPAQIADVKSAIRWVRRNAARSALVPTRSQSKAFPPAGILRCWPQALQEETAVRYGRRRWRRVGRRCDRVLSANRISGRLTNTRDHRRNAPAW